MAKIASSTPAPAGVNAHAHLLAERRAPALPIEDAPTRRASRRRFLAEAGTTIAAGLGVVTAVLSPDPSWGADPQPVSPPASSQFFPVQGTVSLPDAQLAALDVEQRHLDAQLRPLTAAFFRTRVGQSAELNRLADLSDPLAERLDAIAETMTVTEAATLTGWAAKAFALRHQIEQAYAEAGVVCEANLEPELRLAWSLAEDLITAGRCAASVRP